MLQSGIFGTRAGLVVDVVLILNLIAPFWATVAARKIRKGDRPGHIRLQLILAAMLFAAVLVLEGTIRFSGGSGSLIAGSPYAGTPLLRTVFLVHILPAVATYLVWMVLVVTSFRRRHSTLPGAFSRRHRMFGLIVIAGLVWTALSALAVYYFGFYAT